MGADQLEQLSEIAEQLRTSADELAWRQVRACRKFPSYNDVPDEDLHRSSRRNVLRVVETLNGRGILPADISEDEAKSARRRAVQGVPAEDVVACYWAVLAVLRDEFIGRASAAGIPFEVILAGTRRLWDMTDRLSAVLMQARHDIDIALARRDERQKVAFLQRVLNGNLLPSELVQFGTAYGLEPDSEHWVFRARHPQGTPQSLSRHIELTCGGDHFAPLVGPIDGDLVGITCQRPSVNDGLTVLATVGPRPLPMLAQAFAECTRLLNVAVRYHKHGRVDRESLSVRIAVVEESDIGAALFDRYVATVLDSCPMAEEILRSVQVYLARHRRVQAAADALLVHGNTLRYRLDKYTSMTGADLTDTEVIIEVWWALEYWQVRQDRIGNAGHAIYDPLP
ncbi:MAG: PucR family transcriptional regulator [Streptosporangiaceae bacterium]